MMGKRIIRRRCSAPGCDDAPYVTVMRGNPKRGISFVYPYYENPLMLAQQCKHWESLHLKHGGLRVEVVDDGSPENPAFSVMEAVEWATAPQYWIRLRRINVDVRWNWLAARNLGMSDVEGWCLLTDMDHVVPMETFESLVWGNHDPKIIYRFSRREHDGTPANPHPNSWFMTNEMFWKIGGYDEALSGYYGTDGEYRRRAAATAPIRILHDKLIRFEFVLDASTVRYKRKQPEDRAVQQMIAARGPDWKPKTLSFPWTRVPL